MKFVIYGAGYRGKRLLNYLGSDNVVAFIDNNESRLHDLFCEKPIINLEEYKASYNKVFIIISPSYIDENTIERALLSEGIYSFSNMLELPSEFAGYGSCRFIETFGSLEFSMEKIYYIYGYNAFALMIYERLKEENHKVFIVLHPSLDAKRREYAVQLHKDIIADIDEIEMRDNAVVLLSIREEPAVIGSLFPNAEIVDVFDRSSDMPQYYNKEIEKFKHMCKAHRRCFIVATSPSLTSGDLQILNQNHEFCISMNKIFMYEEDWTSDIYACIDSVLLGECEKEVDDYASPVKFIGDSNEEFWSREHKNTYKIHAITMDCYDVVPGFSENICQKVYIGATVTYVCIQIAVYLGFKEIYLLGVDCNYTKNSTNNYFYNSDVVDNKNHHEDRMILSYQAAKKYADAHGIKIYNATRGGALEVFERVDFDSLFEGGK